VHKLLYLGVLALAAVAIAPAAALADPLDAIRADIAQLQSDATTKHDTVLADAQTLQSDATSLVGSDRSTARAKIQADVTRLTTDWHALLATCLADRARLQADIAAAHAAGIGPRQIRPLVREANLQIRASNLEMRSGVVKARAAVFALRQSFRGNAQTPPAAPVPPAAPGGAAPVTP
jgi:hypothetical protein